MDDDCQKGCEGPHEEGRYWFPGFAYQLKVSHLIIENPCRILISVGV